MESDALRMDEQTLFFSTNYSSRKGNKDGLELLSHFENWFSDKKEGEYLKFRVNNYFKHVKLEELMGLLDLNPGSIMAKLKKKIEDEDSECSSRTAKKIKVDPQNHKILTDWLKSKGLDVEYGDIGTFFSNGVRLHELLKTCSKKTLPKIMKDQTKLEICFSFFENRYFDLGTITPRDIQNGNLTETVSLLWKIYDFFEVGCVQPEVPSGKIGLLTWWQMKISSYKNIKIVDFWTSFRDGLAFCAMINLYHPELLNYEELSATSPKHNLSLALEVAETIGIASVFSEKEFLESSASFEPFVVRYAAKFYHAFNSPRKMRTVTTICFVCQQRAADPTTFYEHLKSHAYFLHKDERGVDKMIVNQYKIEETKCDHKGCSEVFPREVDKFEHLKNYHEYSFPCVYFHCRFVAQKKDALKAHHNLHHRYFMCPGCQNCIKDSTGIVRHYESKYCETID